MSLNEDFIKDLNQKMMRGRGSVNDFILTRQTLYEEEDEQNGWNCASWFEYIIVVVFTIVLLVSILVLTLFWVLFYRGGFAWAENPELQFNLHPTLMIAGFITLSGFSIVQFRICRCLKQIYVKLVHMFLHLGAIPCIAVGFVSVYESHNLSEPPKENFHSLHTWLGLVTMGMFLIQFVVGFFSFLVLLCCQKYTRKYRSAMVPLHASFGLVNFLLAVATCLTGLVEKDRLLGNEIALSTRNTEAEHYIMNAMGIILVALSVVISAAVRRSHAPATAKVYVTERI